MYIRRHVKYPLLFRNFSQNLNFLYNSENFSHTNSIKFRPLAADVFLAHWESDRRTDMRRLRVAFWNCGRCLKMKKLTEIQQYSCKLPAYCLTPSSQKHELYTYVNWDIVCCCIWICKHCAYKPFTGRNQETRWTIEVVYPSRERFGPSGDNCIKTWQLSESSCRYNRSVLAVIK